MNTKVPDSQLRSEKVRQLLGSLPPGLVYGGMLALIAMTLALIYALFFIKVPHTSGQNILKYLVTSLTDY